MDPFKVLNLSEGATQTEVDDAYQKLKAFYSEKRFLPGEEGAEACIKLNEIDEAYKKAISIISANYSISGNKFQTVEDAIKENNIDYAQAILDDTINRDAEWYYYQAIVFYKKNWHQDAIKQLELAINLEPHNPKYEESLKELKNALYFGNKDENPKQSFYGTGEGGNGYSGRSYKDTNAEGMPRPVGCCTPCGVCQGLICADCCCECMGGDLISCC